MKNRKIAFGIAVIAGTMLSISCLAAGFDKKAEYTEGMFADVASNAWYASEVKSTYELGFMNGIGQNLFFPDGNVTVSEAITMASRIHASYNSKTIPTVESEKWYQMYVDYAVSEGIIADGEFDNYNRNIKRCEVAELFCDAMPEDYYNSINDVDFIPDIEIGCMYEDKLLTLYNAGIVMGNDIYGSFNPDATIKRSECAAIINRIAIPENRVKGELVPMVSEDAYTLVYNTSMDSSKEGINSGWVLDNRGGTAKITNSGYNTITDISEKYGTAWIREFNYIPKGEIVLETVVNTVDDGAYIEYKDVNGDSVYMIKIISGKWSILAKDGIFTPIVSSNSISSESSGVKLRVSINLDTGKSTTFINDEACGTYDLLSDNVLSFKVGIDETGTGSIKMDYVNMVVNYNAYENFEIFGLESVYGWQTSGEVLHDSKQINFTKDSSAVKSVKPVSGNVCTETYFYSKDCADFDIVIGDLLTVKSVDKKLMVGDRELYSLTQDMWYRLRVESDMEKGIAKVYLNGMLKAEVPIEKKEEISTLSFFTKGDLSVDNIKVYELHEYDDYVPLPETASSMNDYIVGVNICSLWRNGTHYGWHCITPYDEPTPVLGYYDEGNPETADWEIKYMVEHGIDFQAFCWYADVKRGPLKEPRQSSHLHNGYQQAKYSDYMKYCILFEASGGQSFNSNQFREYVIPFWFENYFLDDRYMTIENKLILPVYAAEKLSSAEYFGSVEAVKAELEYLEEVAKSYGFDGVLFFAAGTSGDTLAKMGFDATYAYNWGTAGSSPDVNKNSIINSADVESMYTIPTVSVGFDSIPWHGKRYDLMNVQDYSLTMNWVKEVYEPAYSSKYSWADNLIWLSTWNEYGEGTYISPAGLNGFGYVDVLRNSFTELSSEHTDVIPTMKQKERITHMYPQYARLLRRDGWYTFNSSSEDNAQKPQNKLYINDRNIFESSYHEIPPVIENGTVYFPFEPATCINYIMNVYYEWRRDAGTLLIEANGHSVKLCVGSDRYYKDGVEANLGYVLKLVDNIPMLDYKKLCDDIGYKYEEKNGDLYIYSDNYEEVWKNISERKTGSFEFDSYDAEGWESSDMLFEVSDGILKMTSRSDNRDPIVTYSKNNFPEDFYTGKFTSIEMKVRYKYDGTMNQQICFYFITNVDGTYSESKCFKVALDSLDSKDEWQTITIDLKSNTNWLIADKLTGLRLDPFNAVGTMEIDYIRFIEDPDFVPEEPIERPVAIINGNAEGDEVTFYSNNAVVKIIEDPHKEGNHVWFVDGKLGKQWTYFRHAVNYREGATYKIDFDIKIVGNNSSDTSITDTSYCVNLKYADKGALNDIDHVIVQNEKLSLYDGWKHCAVEYTAKKVDNNEKSEFTIYINPQGDTSFDYYIDNLVVREVGGEGWEDVEVVINENTEGSIIIPDSVLQEDTTSTPIAKGVITINGSADESGIIVAQSNNADITIVSDPDDSTNKVFLVNPKLGKRWTYFKYPYNDIRAGVTYKISYDIKFAGNNANDSSVTTSVFNTNVVYNEQGALNGYDHPISSDKITVDGGWVHCEVTHTVQSITNNKASNFAIYVDPVGDVSIAYYVDNFTVEIVGGNGVVDDLEDIELPEEPMEAGIITVNGDAEGEEELFYSNNATVKRVVDPSDSENMVWYVEAKLGKRWTYFRYPYDKIKAGTIYKISYDIKFAGNNSGDLSVTASDFSTNVVYNESGAQNGSDHPISKQRFSQSDGWVHCEVTHTVASIDDNKSSNFAIYVDPVGEASINYYVDNFVVEIIR